MAQFGQDLDNFSATRTIKISKAETVETHTVYIIDVNIGPYTWTVKHRYSEFHELHEKLVSSCKVDKNLLPRKKLFGNQTDVFIRKRQNDLEVYLQTILYYVAHKLPGCLASFLDFNQYEIHGITQIMAEELYNKGDLLLQAREVYRTTPLQLYALTERLKLPEPTCESGDVKRDLGHILDYITRLKHLQVGGGLPVGTSNLDMNQLTFDLTLFKSLQCLQLFSCDVSLISGFETVKQTLQRLTVHRCLKSIRDMMLQDIPHWRSEDGTLVVAYWDSITHVDFSHNSLTQIDDSMQLMPKCVDVNLSHNQITSIQNLQWLSHMTHLDLSHNSIQNLETLHSKIGNLKKLNLSANNLESLQGLSKLFSLETLNVSNNNISSIEEVKPVCTLPCLENLSLLGNPVTITLDYRTKTLAMFRDRVNEVSLDGDLATQQELDTVAVLQALQKSRDKSKLTATRKSPRDAAISDLSSMSPPSPYPHQLYPPAGLHPSPGTSQQPGAGPSDQTSGNQVRARVSMIQRYSLFSRVGRDSGWPGAIDSSSSSTVDSTIISTDIRGRVESMRDEWGTGWLTLLDTSHILTTPSQNEDGELSKVSPVYTVSDLHGISSPQCSTSPPLPQPIHQVNIAALPHHNSDDFNRWLHARLFGEGGSTTVSVETIKFVMWCPAVQYSNINTLLPACVVLTERRIFILRLKSILSSFPAVPELETYYILPLSNVQQVVIGLCYSLIRVEESFMGASGTFTFLVSDSDKGKAFFEELRSTCEMNAESGDLDIINGSQNSDLSSQIFDLEEVNGFCTGRIAFAAHVMVAQSGSLVHLVLSENQVYIVKSCCLFWPKPTFDISEIETGSKFEMAQQFSIEGKISEIQMYTPDANQRRKSTEMPNSPTHSMNYQEFGLSMVFHESLGSHKFDFQFLCSKARDTFLDRLTNLRSEHAHRMSPTIREEPDGGNESSDGLNDNSNGKSPELGREKERNSGLSDYTDDSDSEYLTGNDSSGDRKCGSPFSEHLTRKPRAKTEIIITKCLVSEDEQRELPNYTWHYLSPELINHLSTCVQQYPLVQPLSAKLQCLTEMSGEQIAQYFHNNIVPVGVESEELHHILWTNVIPYTSPKDEIVTCIMLSNRAVYFVSDRLVKQHRSPGRPSWMTHARHVSDSIIGLQSKMVDKHHSAGILHSSEQVGRVVKPYCILDFGCIQQINVGLFDQCVRITGNSEELVYTLVTRNAETSSVFLRSVSSMLSLYIASPMLEKSSNDLEQDFYKAFSKRTKTTVEGIEYVHPSKVKFYYPGDEAISDLLFIINEHLRSVSFKVGRENILSYTLGYRTQSPLPLVSSILLEPITIILTNDCLCFLTEDLVSYPLPDFVRGLPGTPPHNVLGVNKIEYLKYVIQPKDDPREMSLVFSDEKEEIKLVYDYYSIQETDGRESPPEIAIRLLIQSEREKAKFLLLLQSQWRDKHQGLDLKIQSR